MDNVKAECSPLMNVNVNVDYDDDDGGNKDMMMGLLLLAQ